MKLLNRLSLTTKTRLPVVMVLIIMSSVVAVAYTSFTEQQRVNRTVVEQILPVQNSLEDAYRDFYQVIAAGQGLIVGGLTTENVAHQKAEFLDNGNKARDRLSQVQTLIDAGAALAMREKGASLLPGGITGADGAFRRGDMVQVCWNTDAGRVCVARGVSQYAADDVRRIAGRHTRDIQTVLGYNYGGTVVHRDDLVLP